MVDVKSKYESLMTSPSIERRPYQEEIIKTIASNSTKNYVVRLPTGTGKTLVGYGIFYKRQELGNIPPDAKALVLVDRRNLVYQWRDLGVRYGIEKILGDKIYINNMNNAGWEQLIEAAKKKGKSAKECYINDLQNATWIISTPQLFMNGKSQTLGNFKYIEEAGIHKKIKYVIIDEVGEASSADRLKKNSDRLDIVESMSPSIIYEPIINIFLRECFPQVVGLTAIFDRDERQANIEHVLGAETITVPPEAVQKYIPDLRRHEVFVKEDYISQAVKLLLNARDRSLEAIRNGAGFWYWGATAIDDACWSDLLGTILRSRESALQQYKWDARFALYLTHWVLPEIYAAVKTSDLIQRLKDKEKVLFNPNFEDISIERYNEAKRDWLNAMTCLNTLSQEKEYTGKAVTLCELLKGKLMDGYLVEPETEDVLDLNIKFDKRGYLKPDIHDESVLIFTRRVNSAEQLAHLLSVVLGDTRVLTGKLSTDDINTVIRAFKNKDIRILVVTDRLLGRGTDLPEANIVVDYDFSANPAEAYQRVSRIRGGDAYTLVYENTSEERKYELMLNPSGGIGETHINVPGTSLADALEQIDEETLEELLGPENGEKNGKRK